MVLIMTKRTRAAAILAALLAAGFFLGGTVATHGLFSAEMASWVQGIGTVAAIVATLIIARNQEIRADRYRIEEQLNRIEAANSASKLVYSAIIVGRSILTGSRASAMTTHGEVNVICDIAEHALNALHASDYDNQEIASDLGSLKIISAQLRSHTVAMLNEESWWSKSQIDRAIEIEDRYSRANVIRNRLAELKSEYREKLGKLK
jgi:hypothetical protein